MQASAGRGGGHQHRSRRVDARSGLARPCCDARPRPGWLPTATAACERHMATRRASCCCTRPVPRPRTMCWSVCRHRRHPPRRKGRVRRSRMLRALRRQEREGRPLALRRGLPLRAALGTAPWRFHVSGSIATGPAAPTAVGMGMMRMGIGTWAGRSVVGPASPSAPRCGCQCTMMATTVPMAMLVAMMVVVAGTRPCRGCPPTWCAVASDAVK